LRKLKNGFLKEEMLKVSDFLGNYLWNGSDLSTEAIASGIFW